MGIRTGILIAVASRLRENQGTRIQTFPLLYSESYYVGTPVMDLPSTIYHPSLLLSHYEVDEFDLAHRPPYIALNQARAELDRRVTLCLSRSASGEN